jgi:hypothetical protein
VDDEAYAEFDVFSHRGPADSLRSRLRSEGIPCYVEPQALSGAMETQFAVFVLRKLEHRARWVVSQLPPSEAELEFLATGKLPGEEEREE